MFTAVFVLLLVRTTNVSHACQYSQTGSEGDTITVGAADKDPCCGGSNAASISNTIVDCAAGGLFQTQVSGQSGARTWLIDDAGPTQTTDWAAGHVGSYDETYTTSNSCYPPGDCSASNSNCPGAVSFENGACADIPPGLKHANANQAASSQSSLNEAPIMGISLISLIALIATQRVSSSRK